MNKKAQFFIIFAVIFGILILGVSTQFNFAKSQDFSEDFFRTCDNYKHEAFMISQEATNELEEIRQLTTEFMNHKDIEILFIYGKSSSVRLINNFEEEITTNFGKVSSGGEILLEDVIEITISKPIKKTFTITEHRNFYPILRTKRENEVYYC
ncbi:MAG: hypothetical protein JSW08_02215 [archaeon]|nr:MAG: hypothetical protein JSW08_02215 [archaeon]